MIQVERVYNPKQREINLSFIKSIYRALLARLFSMKRRSLLKYSLITGGAVATGSLLYSKIPFDEVYDKISEFDLTFFDQQDLPVLLAIIPVILAGTQLSSKQLVQVIQSMDSGIQLLSLQTQNELRELFDLLSNKLGRVILTGVWASWRTANTTQLIEFLNDWRNSYLDLLQVGYQGLKQLIVGHYYAEPEHWKQIGYPGPPKLS